MLFANYFEEWIMLYKKDRVSEVTLNKYKNSKAHLIESGLDVDVAKVDRKLYQTAINKLGESHSLRTVGTFHKHFKAALDDAVEDDLITKNPANKAVVSGMKGRGTRKFLDYGEWKNLLSILDTTRTDQMMIYIAATTGMRYGEIAGLTTQDIDWNSKTINISKTWDYKYGRGFQPTKNESSNRKIAIDNKTLNNLKLFVNRYALDNRHDLIFWSSCNRIMHSSEINATLTNVFKTLGISRVTFHGLRHTHASVLLFGGMNVLSVSRRLGHASTTTTQEIYLHLVREMEARDNATLQRLFDGI